MSELGIVIPHRPTWPSDKQNITLTILQFPLFPATLFKVGQEYQDDNLLHDSLLRIMSTTLTLTQNSFKLPSPRAALSPAAFRRVSFTTQLTVPSCSCCSSPPLLALVPAICCQFLDKSHPQTSSFCLLHCPLPHSPEVSSPISHLARRASSSSLGEHSRIEKHQLKKKGGVGME